MDQELIAFVGRAVQPIVTRLAGAAGDAVRAGVARILSRGRQDRADEQQRVLDTKVASSSPEALQQWLTGRLEAVLEDRPEFAHELAELAGLAPPRQPGSQINIATGNARQVSQFQGVQRNDFGSQG
ncbi:hypothetical protein [Actinocatenispora thailandica]|uniref:hypothetical protein n=1 Tax=Actinocatenispora thailandica TaxID=227318 RepID=UPI00195078EA|nr:hypothetical protein [Actinocatenispora thailandica]